MELVLGGGARRFLWSSAVAAGVAFVLIACGAVKQRGELMLAMQTDLELPKDVDTVRIEVTSFGKTLFGQDYDQVGTDGHIKIPATLAVVGDPASPSTPIEVRVIAKQEGALRVLRNVTTTVPPDRTAILRMPLAWLCWNQVTTDATNAPQSSCPTGQTCIAGECTTNVVDSKLLKEFDPSQVFGGSSNPDDGACVDTVACFQGGVVQIVDTTDCSIPKPASPGKGTNVAMLRKPGVPGICDDAGTACYVPLDQDDDEGWKASGDKILLPRAVCDRLAEPSSSKVSIVGVTLTTTCATKTASIPTCGPWSSVGNKSAAGADGGGTGNQSTSFDGTWVGTIAGEACDGSGGLQTSLTISQDPGGNYLVGASVGPVDTLDGQCQTVGQNGLPATLNEDGSLTFAQPLGAYCSCATADDNVTLTLNGGVLTESNFFTGVVSCPNATAHNSADASAPLADAGTGTGDGTSTDSGVTPGAPAGGASFCATCSDVSCTISATLTRGDTGTNGGDAGTISEPDGSAGGKPQCGPQNCTGCCDITTETCQPGVGDTTCGTGSIECADCTALGETCNGGQCIFGPADSGASKCGPGNCTGCCQGNVCQPGNQSSACGGSGGQCQDCTALSAICSASQCVKGGADAGVIPDGG